MSGNPAGAAGLDDRGVIPPGKRADVIRVHAYEGAPAEQHPLGAPCRWCEASGARGCGSHDGRVRRGGRAQRFGQALDHRGGSRRAGGRRRDRLPPSPHHAPRGARGGPHPDERARLRRRGAQRQVRGAHLAGAGARVRHPFVRDEHRGIGRRGRREHVALGARAAAPGVPDRAHRARHRLRGGAARPHSSLAGARTGKRPQRVQHGPARRPSTPSISRSSTTTRSRPRAPRWWSSWRGSRRALEPDLVSARARAASSPRDRRRPASSRCAAPAAPGPPTPACRAPCASSPPS